MITSACKGVFIMQVHTIDNTNFKSLYRGANINGELKKGVPKEFKSTLFGIERFARKNNLHKKENVDIFLNYSKEENTFYGVISSKEQGVPMNPAYKCKVSAEKKSLADFLQWVNDWNEAYSPEELNNFRTLIKNIKSFT